MSLSEIVGVLKSVRADYVATCRENHGLRKLKSKFKPEEIMEVTQLDEAIRQLIIARDSLDATRARNATV